MSPSAPPPIPLQSPIPQRSGMPIWAIALIIAGPVLMILVFFTAIIVTALQQGKGETFTITEEHRKALHQARDLEELCGFETDPECETWTADRGFDGAVEISYEYDDASDEAPYLSTGLYYEPKLSDSITGHTLLWQGIRLGTHFGGDGDIHIEESDESFRWGDSSHFGYLRHSSGRYGMVFCGRKGKFVYQMIIGGTCIEDREQLEGFMKPKLEALEQLKFSQ